MRMGYAEDEKLLVAQLNLGFFLMIQYWWPLVSFESNGGPVAPSD